MKPKRIQLSIKCKCQFNCDFCTYTGQVDEMSMEVFKDLVDRFYEFGVRDFELTPTTGEVFLDKLLLDKILYLNSLSVNKIILFTNVYHVDEELLENIKGMSSVEINLSLYGGSRSQFKVRTGVDGFDQVVDNLKKYITWQLYTNNTVVVHRRFKGKRISRSLDLLLRVANENNIKIWDCSYDTSWLNMVKYNLNVIESVNKGVCRFALEDNGVYPNGDISLCGWFDTNKDMLIGNVHEQSLYEIYGEGSVFDTMIKEQEIGVYKNLCGLCGMRNVKRN